MDKFGISNDGFKRKTYQDILISMEAKTRELFGEDVNLNERSPLGLFIKVIAWSLSTIWKTIEKVYYGSYVDDAEGIQLDRVAKSIGIFRRPPEWATGTIQLTGDEGTSITPSNLIIGTKNEINFIPTESVIIGSTGKATVAIMAKNYGPSGNVPIGAISEIVTPLSGLHSVTNESATKGGRNAEADHEFRDRYYKSTSRAGASTVDSITASLLDVTGVRTARVIQNTSMLPDEKGRPPKSIQCYVLGGDKEAVAKAIFSTKPAGIETYGDESEIVTDISGGEHVVKFSYAQVRNVFVQISLKRNDKYTPDGDKLITTEVIKYIGGIDIDEQLHNGLSIGNDVIFIKLISSINKVTGVEDFELKIGLSQDNLQSANITILDTEVAETSPDKVVISYV